MLTHASGRARRRGITLIELMISLSVAGIVLAMVAMISLRQQRTFADLADQNALAGQLRDAALLMPIDLRGVASGAGDIREARDTAMEMRAAIAGGVVCDTLMGARILVAPSPAGSATLSGFLAPADVGDTAWLLAPADTADTWRPHRIISVANAAPGQCAPLGPRLGAAAQAAPRIALGLSPPPDMPIGAPLRITRPVRYSAYRAADGGWYIGQKDWNNALARYNTIQPLAGPFLTSTTAGVGFRYADTMGTALPSPVADTRAIALIRLEMRGQTKSATRVLGAAAGRGKRTDSTVVAIALRNRR